MVLNGFPRTYSSCSIVASASASGCFIQYLHVLRYCFWGGIYVF